jgi:hypothetical protein
VLGAKCTGSFFFQRQPKIMPNIQEGDRLPLESIKFLVLEDGKPVVSP